MATTKASRPTAWASRQIDQHANTILFLLLVVSLIAAIWAALGWKTARDAQRRVTTIEVQRELERQARSTAAVAACFRTLAARPQVVEIFDAFADQLEPKAGKNLRGLISTYSRSTVTAEGKEYHVTAGGCLRMSRDLAVDPKPYLQNPSKAAGNRSK